MDLPLDTVLVVTVVHVVQVTSNDGLDFLGLTDDSLVLLVPDGTLRFLLNGRFWLPLLTT